LECGGLTPLWRVGERDSGGTSPSGQVERGFFRFGIGIGIAIGIDLRMIDTETDSDSDREKS
jgi:hypothetical protein